MQHSTPWHGAGPETPADRVWQIPFGDSSLEVWCGADTLPADGDGLGAAAWYSRWRDNETASAEESGPYASSAEAINEAILAWYSVGQAIG